MHPPSDRPGHALGEVIATATATAALLPFVQTLATKAAEDSYSGVRTWLRRRFRESEPGRVPPGAGHREVLVVTDPALGLRLYLPTEASDRMLLDLARLDLTEQLARAASEQVTVRIFWDEREQRWRTDD